MSEPHLSTPETEVMGKSDSKFDDSAAERGSAYNILRKRFDVDQFIFAHGTSRNA